MITEQVINKNYNDKIWINRNTNIIVYYKKVQELKNKKILNENGRIFYETI